MGVEDPFDAADNPGRTIMRVTIPRVAAEFARAADAMHGIQAADGDHPPFRMAVACYTCCGADQRSLLHIDPFQCQDLLAVLSSNPVTWRQTGEGAGGAVDLAMILLNKELVAPH